MLYICIVMSYPSNGKNHHIAVKDEQKLSENINIYEKHYGKKVEKIIPIGGTKSKTDILIIFEDGTKIKISLKSKNSIRKGSFDYVNSSCFGILKENFVKTLETYVKYNNSRNLKGYELLKKNISEDLLSIPDKYLTQLFKESVIDKYDELSLVIQDKKEGKIYFDVKPKVFAFVKNGGILKLKNTGKNTMSYQLIGYDTNGQEFEFGLRIRVHLNNGKTKWLNEGSSTIVFKFQQDYVHKII
jgi:hypothetical protein